MIMKKLLFIMFILSASAMMQAQNLTILHLNDTHSHIDPERSGDYAGRGGVIEQAAYVDEVRAEEGRKNVLLLHAGDFSQGTSYFTELQGDIEIDVFNAMKFDAVCLGNHEFDNGMHELARRLSSLKVPVVCANYDFSGTVLDKYVKPYVIVRKAGKRIGIIGLLADLADVVDSNIAKDLKFINPAETVEKYAEILKKDKNCDIVICLTHLGYEGEPYTDRELAASTRNVDVIVGGHSHTLLDKAMVFKNKDGDDVLVVTDWKWGLNMGKLTLKD